MLVKNLYYETSMYKVLQTQTVPSISYANLHQLVFVVYIMYILNGKYQNEAIRTNLIITFHLAQILELQHLDVATVVQFDHALLQTEHNIIPALATSPPPRT